jgi:hypothetical protein
MTHIIKKIGELEKDQKLKDSDKKNIVLKVLSLDWLVKVVQYLQKITRGKYNFFQLCYSNTNFTDCFAKLE